MAQPVAAVSPEHAPDLMSSLTGAMRRLIMDVSRPKSLAAGAKQAASGATRKYLV